ncbi:hypothetical protein MKW94_004282 [Papaver nudicaule]|uniref:Phytocyanin domain-containing protein n=1 Tax=Papaver nudicaule TaxID=74823 RepID=A0AA41VBE5_PAPNU|nr:hypothetical protein [Papaver nudicaule]
MEASRLGLRFGCCVLMALLMIAPGASAEIWSVGGNDFWTVGVNYTRWAEQIKFHKGDWLYFVYETPQYSLLQVNKKGYEACNPKKPFRNLTTSSGRVPVLLSAATSYYFIDGQGYCFGGMKVAVRVLG